MSNPYHINYAHWSGIHSVPVAIIFAVLYIPLLGWFVRQSFARPTYVHFVLSLFCAIRIAAFGIRAALAGLDSAGENLSLLIADQVLSGVGFFGLLYSAYTLVLDLEQRTGRPAPTSPLLRITRNRHAFRAALMAAVVLGIVSATLTNTDGSTSDTSKSLRKASIIIFLVLTILQAFQTLVLVRMEVAEKNTNKHSDVSFGARHAMPILLLVSLLLLVREAFTAATINNGLKQNNERFWYPLIALPEILAVTLYATPGLVPRRDELSP
ncbi:hypothetical protein M413DRAFT_439029 [Hebeloma cylindrosporum]|uniref:RTA1 like protein n=1 Tax=Hebeloma cylindrosporum TaxID=76867 RepID=A0A0C3D188_HEBCY|nr:hypothetical protein M413DRAFT_439029 [Hebeloma cylindrosporum h7]